MLIKKSCTYIVRRYLWRDTYTIIVDVKSAKQKKLPSAFNPDMIQIRLRCMVSSLVLYETSILKRTMSSLKIL